MIPNQGQGSDLPELLLQKGHKGAQRKKTNNAVREDKIPRGVRRALIDLHRREVWASWIVRIGPLWNAHLVSPSSIYRKQAGDANEPGRADIR